MSRKKKISTEISENSLNDSPFSSLESAGLPSAPLIEQSKVQKTLKVKDRLGQGERLEIRREKSGRGGKTVTTIQGFPTYLSEKRKLNTLKTLKTSLGTGGSWNKETIELQGDRRSEVFRWLEESGFSPVLAGG